MKNKHNSQLLLAGLAYLSFISLGLPDGLLGVAWPSIRSFFQLPLDALGSLLVLYTGGYLLSSFASGWALERLGVGALLALSCLGTAASLLGYAVAPAWWVMVVLGFLAGLGAGAIDAGMNTFAAKRFSARTVNWLHGFWGVGAAAGPVLMTSVMRAGLPWQRGYALVAAGQLFLALCFGLTRALWSASRHANQQTSPAVSATARRGNLLRRPALWLSAAAFFLYTGLEATAGIWSYSLFTEARGISMRAAGLAVTAYWGGLTAGRFLLGALAGRLTARRLLHLCAAGMALGALLLWLPVNAGLSFLGLALLGLCAGPVFPSLIATTSERLGEADTARGVGYQVAAGVLGQALLPACFGLVAMHLSLEALGFTLLLGAATLWSIFPAMSPTPSVTAEQPRRTAERNAASPSAVPTGLDS